MVSVPNVASKDCVHEMAFLKVSTSKGVFTIETHNEHNGFTAVLGKGRVYRGRWNERLVMNESNQDTRILDLIEKLLRLSDSPNRHEAEAAAVKAQSLILKYNVDTARLTGLDDDPVICSDFICL